MSKITASSDFDRIEAEEIPRILTLFADQVVQIVNGGLEFSANFNAKTVSITFASANTDTSVGHGLGRTPAGYLVTSRSANMVIYDGSVANNTSTLILRSSAPGTASVLVF
jgi:hypothetical protein